MHQSNHCVCSSAIELRCTDGSGKHLFCASLIDQSCANSSSHSSRKVCSGDLRLTILASMSAPGAHASSYSETRSDDVSWSAVCLLRRLSCVCVG